MSIASRLQTPITVDFRRTSLTDAFAWIAEETGVPIEIDGAAFKQAGYTKNMVQTFKMEKTPAMNVLRTIQKAYPKMAMVVDQSGQRLLVTTQEAARAKGAAQLQLNP